MSARVVVSCRGGLVDAGSAASTCPSRLPRAPRRQPRARPAGSPTGAVSTDSPSTDEERTASARPDDALEEYPWTSISAWWSSRTARGSCRAPPRCSAGEAPPLGMFGSRAAATVHVADAEYYAGLQDECESVRRRAVRADHGRAKLGARRAAHNARPPGGLRLAWGPSAKKRASVRSSLEGPSRRRRTTSGPTNGRRSASHAPLPSPLARLFAPPGSGTRPDGGLARAGVRARPARAAGRAGPHAAVVVRRGHAAGRATAAAGGSRGGGFASARRGAERRPTSEIPGVGAKARSLVDRLRSGSNRGGGRTPRARYHQRSALG